jgi:hypothetical protein
MVLTGFVAGWMAATARTVVAKTAPIGYEDETGFHLGDPVDE